MKQIKSSYHSAYFPPIKLFRNDLEEIVSRLNKICKEVVFRDESHEFDNLDDIRSNLGLYVKKLKIDGKNPDISIEIGQRFPRDDVYLSSSGSSDEAKLLFYELREFLQSKLKWVSKINFKFMWFFVVGSFSLMPLTSTLKSLAQNNVYIIPFVLVFLIITIIYLALYLYRGKTGSSIYLDHKHNLDFWQTNKDKIIVGLIMAMIGILGTLLTQFIIKKFF